MKAGIRGGCWICRDWQREHLCAACLARFAAPRPRCPRCALPLEGAGAPCAACLSEPLPLEAVSAAVDYQPPWDGLLQRWKYEAALGLTPAFADVLADRVPPAPDALLLPVPTHPARLRERGYAQAELLAQALAQRMNREIQADWLRRVIDTPAQAGLARAARVRNLGQAFALTPAAQPQGRHCVLVDDVMTTGATLATLATLLRHAGASRVDAWVIARTPAPD